jgi:hypothetical protein
LFGAKTFTTRIGKSYSGFPAGSEPRYISTVFAQQNGYIRETQSRLGIRFNVV